jgi:hypothetical protein
LLALAPALPLGQATITPPAGANRAGGTHSVWKITGEKKPAEAGYGAI